MIVKDEELEDDEATVLLYTQVIGKLQRPTIEQAKIDLVNDEKMELFDEEITNPIDFGIVQTNEERREYFTAIKDRTLNIPIIQQGNDANNADV